MTSEYKWARRAVSLVAVILFAAFFLIIRYRFPSYLSNFQFASATGSCLVYALFALLIIKRHPRHTIGWLFLIVSFFAGLDALDDGLYALVSQLSSIEARQWLIWFSHQIWAPWTLLPITLILLYFPDGKLPSHRWRIIAYASIFYFIYLHSSQAFIPWMTESYRGVFDVDNPLRIPGSELLFSGTMGTIFTGIGSMGFIGCLLSLIVRFRRSDGIEKQQIKWLAYAATLNILFLLALMLAGQQSEAIGYTLVSTTPSFLALVMGIAILRHRLFDIDIIIRRTLQYSVLSGVLALLYLGGVTLIQTLFFSGQSSRVAVVVSTLVIAALFNPLRLRIQEGIDRRFYRTKYDAERVLARFAATARDEVEIDKLTQALLDAVQETMQPEKVSLWLREREHQTRN